MERIHGPLFGPRRDDLRAATIVAMLVNLNRSKGEEPLTPEDVALRFAEGD